MSEWTQEGRSIGIETPLGADALLLLSINGQESLSETYSYQLQLISQNHTIQAKDLIGKKVDIWFRSQDGNKRYLNAYINRFAAGPMKAEGYRNYRAQIVPWLWFLNKKRDCRIFQNKTAPEVIQEIFESHQIADFNLNLGREHRNLDYCVQYRESQLDFVSRLCKENGLFYFFSHEQGKHTLTLADKTTAYQRCEEFEVIQTSNAEVFDHINSWEQEFEFISGAWAQTDYNPKTPSTDLSAQAKTLIDLPDVDKYEVFDYPGEYSNTEDARTQTDIRMMEEEAGYDIINASGNYRSFFAGGTFQLKQHDFEHEHGKNFVITRISLSASEAGYFANDSLTTMYKNEFTAIPHNILYFNTEETLKPLVHGPQTAIVVGPDGQDIFTDEQGRIKVQFFWDRHNNSNENSSCWLRVSQNWAGKGWGSMDLPHVGHEVIVSFMEGNPDRPIVTGRVYNETNTPAIESKTNQHKNIIRDEYGNEIILDATPDDEHIRIYSPHHDSGIELGKSVTSWTDSDSNTLSFGNSYELGAGTALSAFAGAKMDASIGLAGTLSAAMKFDISAGANYTFTTGYTNAWTANTWINASNASILNQAKKDILTGAGGAICYVANCSTSDNRSIYYADKDKISLSTGDSLKPYTGTNKWYEPYGSMKESVAMVVTMLLATLSAGIISQMVAPSDAEAEDGDCVTGGEIAAATIWSVNLAIFIGILAYFAIKDGIKNNSNAAVKSIEHEKDNEELKLELNNDLGAILSSKIKPITISKKNSTDENDGKELKLFIHEDVLFLGRGDRESLITIGGADNAGIIISNEDASGAGEISLYSKDNIVLDAKNAEVVVSSQTCGINKNLKVVA